MKLDAVYTYINIYFRCNMIDKKRKYYYLSNIMLTGYAVMSYCLFACFHLSSC